MIQVIFESSLENELGIFFGAREFSMAIKLVVFPSAQILDAYIWIIDEAFSVSF